MDRTRTTALVALVAAIALALSPAAAAQDGDADEGGRKTSFVTFYGHLFGFGRDTPMPMNTQFPDGEEDISQGIDTTCGVEVGDTPAASVRDCDNERNNEVWFYTTAGFVQIKDQEEFTYEAIHNERGLTKDTYLDKSQNIKATIHMSADAHGWYLFICDPNLLAPVKPHDVPWPGPCWNWDPGYLSQWQVEATVFVGTLGEYGGEANTPPPIAAAFESGALQVLAQGVSKPVDVQSLEVAGQPTVWRFDVDLGPPQQEVIPKEMNYLVRFKWWSLQGGNKVSGPLIADWNVDGGEYFPPSITLPVKNAFDVELLVPQFVHEKLVIHGILNTPWGSYDVNQGSVKLLIEDPQGSEIEPIRIQKLADYSVAHGAHYKPVNVTYVWDYKLDKLKPGTYRATISAENFQGSASGACAGTFSILEGGAPGPITIGQCGVRTISEEQLSKVQTGASGGSSGSAAPLPLPVAPPVKVASAAATPLPTTPVAVAPLVALALAVLVLRRGRSA